MLDFMRRPQVTNLNSIVAFSTSIQSYYLAVVSCEPTPFTIALHCSFHFFHFCFIVCLGPLNNLKESMIQFSKPRKLTNKTNPVSLVLRKFTLLFFGKDFDYSYITNRA